MHVNGCQAPAIQLAEHARAILEDDRALGIDRKDPVLKRLASGATHAVTYAEIVVVFQLVLLDHFVFCLIYAG